MSSLAVILVALTLASASGDTWQSLAELPPGPERGRRVAALLATETGPLDGAAQRLAYEAGTRASEDLDLELALDIQRPLYALVGASWSAYDLALTEQRQGNVDGADALFAELLASTAPADAPGLWGQRGILALGAGRGVSARAYLGRAIALGDPDAAAVLAREALAGHNLGPSKNGFRTALGRNPAHPWALRGWGLSLLFASSPRN